MRRIILDLSYLKYPPPEKMLKELTEELKDINLCPSGDYDNLRRKVAGYFGVTKKNVLAGNGSDELIDLMTRLWKGKILIPGPTFSQFEIAADREGSEKVLANCLREDKYYIDYSREQLSEASLVWICNPNNPTGTRVPREKIINILQRAEGMVAVDECYYEYLGESVIDLIDKFDNLTVLRSFSKNFGLSGLRLGFAVSAPENIRKLERLRQIFNVNKIAEKAGEKCLKYLDYYQEAWGKIKRVRDNFVEQVNRLGFKAYDSKANFVLVKFEDKRETRRVWEYLKENGIYTFPAWSEEFSGLKGRFIRFTIGTEKEMDKTIEVLCAFLRQKRTDQK